MEAAVLTEMARRALVLAFEVSLPALAAGLLVALVVGALQGATQHGDPTAGFAPRLIAVGAVLLLFGSWIVWSLLRFWIGCWETIPGLLERV